MTRSGLFDIASLIFLVAIVWMSPSLAGDPGFGWHLRSGLLILEQGTIPHSDPFPTISFGKPWIHSQWLSDVIFAFCYQQGGFALLRVLTALVLLSAFVWLPVWGARKRTSPLFGFFIVLLAGVSGAVQWFYRPVIFSFLGFSLLLAILHRELISGALISETVRRIIAPLTFVFVLWANMHPAFILGLAACGILLGAQILNARTKGVRAALVLLGFLLILVFVTAVNPYGLAVYQEMYKLGSSSYFMHLNSEWKMVDVRESTFWPFLVLVVIFELAVFRSWVLLPKGELLLVVLFGCGAFLQRRYIPFFSIACAHCLVNSVNTERLPMIFQRLRHVAPRGSGAMVSFVVVLSLCVWSLLTKSIPLKTPESFPSSFPSQAAEYFREHGAGRVFTTPDWGGYFIFQNIPTLQLYIDDRNQLHGEQAYRDYFDIVRREPDWPELVDHYQFRWLLLQNFAPLLEQLQKSSMWHEIPLGSEGYVLFERTNFTGDSHDEPQIKH